ncbi:hypothetical protein M409DRAFT_48394 [Zasmidium cellare ATCC 36951]|uniref:Fe2OG dioxygenase domain-containing protein n=1 Tax=Zasmidium cellare ATCC 36951 TaxID=1080233 RepID=A0A6A6D220_ZASCE|nr:uncharacterized protein M409DRAFT_48394 [Zasmidium cellare ATCC 36951]KAF2173411.1 hypothetical protein M409DRAFT_48394 [Zasmidium cellare ATCC 36951]
MVVENDAAPSTLDGWDSLPPFPTNIPVASVNNISHARLLNGDAEELKNLLSSARTTGFVRIDFTDTELGRRFLDGADKMFKLAAKTFDLPAEVKLNDNMLNHGDALLGYKGLGASVVDKDGTRDNNEQYWIGCGDIAGEGHSRAIYNDVLNAHMHEMKSFQDTGKEMTDQLLMVFAAVLGISADSPDYLPKLHSHSQNSGSHVRLLKCPSRPSAKAANLQPHTDWGTLTVLFNALGGLQLYLPQSLLGPDQEAGWYYVKPERGTALVNLGDAMVSWSDGEFKSNIHRVVAPPGEQAQWARYSLAYFTRPNHDVPMKPLGRKITAANSEEQYPTFKEWAMRRALAGRADTFKKGDWEKGQGTEGKLAVEARA